MTEKTIYQKLLDAVDKLPKEAIEKAPKEITRKGSDTTGYGYQFLINVMNDVCGIDGWNYKYSILKESEGTWNNGKAFYEICVLVEITIDKTTKGMPGGHKAEMYSDALKGAITNGIKKTLGMFGVGKKAYEGTIDEDFRPIPTPTGTFTENKIEYPEKQCPECGKTHTGKYPKCLDCYKSGSPLKPKTKKLINEDAEPFPDEYGSN